nr:protein kinase family protein [Pseudonocardia acidicola]
MTRSLGQAATAQVPEQTRPADEVTSRPKRPASPSAPTSADTTAGSVLADRYRLISRVGSELAAGAEFWRAEDTILQRDVAITLLRRLAPDPHSDDPEGATRAGEMIVRALRSGCFEHHGCARLLDVLAPGASGIPDDVLGAAVAEWVPGRSLGETITAGLIKPLAAARMVEPLAAAAEAAHRQGLVLGCDHPQRIRVTPDGRAQLAFVLPRPGVRPADDVRGLGAVLYALLTSRWPLSGSDAAQAGLGAAVPGEGGNYPAPSTLRPGVPVELDALTSGTLGSDGAPGRVHTAAAVHKLLAEVVAEDDRAALFPPVHDGVPSAPGDVWQDEGRAVRPVDPERRRKLAIGLCVLGAGMLIVFGYLGVQIGSLFGDSGGPRIVVGNSAAPPAAPAAAPAPAPVGGSTAIQPATVEVYDNTGDKDNAGRISRVIDGDPTTSWRTYIYKQQFPTLKPGVGVMASFVSPVQLSSLSIDSPSDGTIVQIRSAPSADADFADTVPIAQATLNSGVTQISLAQSQPVQHLLVWITKLSGGNDQYVTEINEITFQRAGD